jgi:hypothetical protein
MLELHGVQFTVDHHQDGTPGRRRIAQEGMDVVVFSA